MRCLKIITALCLLFIVAGCTTVMTREFTAKHEFHRMSERWRIGPPRVVAFVGNVEASMWHSQNFEIYIPFSTEKDEYDDIRETSQGLREGRVRVDSVEVRFLTIGECFELGPRLELRDGELRPVVSLLQSYKSLRSAACLVMDTITIPAAEDSIVVSFFVEGPDAAKADSTHFSFTLHRKEGKKKVLDALVR